jgi:membrane protease YdiL (CAAX protease family)
VKHRIPFTTACLYELALLGLAALWAGLFRDPVFARLHWNLKDLAAGIGAVVPLFGLLIWATNSRFELMREHRELVCRLVRSLTEGWSVSQIALLSVIAGIAEETLFRGAIQTGLEGRIGVKLAVVVTSIAFGAAHPITWTYAIFATLIGAYLGGLYVWTGDLMAPIATHAIYDFVALMYLRRKPMAPQ